MPLPIEQVEHIANLARLELTPEELAQYQEQLSDILDYFKQLQAIPTENIRPTTSGSALEVSIRRDQVIEGLNLEDVLKNAAATEKEQFKVPPVFE